MAEDYTQGILHQEKIWNEKKGDCEDSLSHLEGHLQGNAATLVFNFYVGTREGDSVLGGCLAR